MKTTDLFKINRSSKRLNESIEKTFGKKLNLESFDLEKLQDARNKLRTQLSQVRSESGFNENLENEAYTQAQWMLDAINAEISERQEFIADPSQATVEYNTNEGSDSMEERVMELLKKFDESMNEIGGYGDPDAEKIIDLLKQGDVEGATEVVWYAYSDQDGGEVDMDGYIDDLEAEFEALVQDDDSEPDDNTDDGYALASAGFGSDEDYESVEQEDITTEGPLWKDTRYSDNRTGFGRRDREDDWDEGNTEPPNNFAIYINGKKWKVFKGRGQYADDAREMAHYRQLKDWCAKKSAATGKKWEVSITGEPATESIETESAPPTAKGERMVKHIKKGYANDGQVTDKEKSIAYATAWKQHNKDKNESVETGEDMTKLQEGEIQQASAIVSAKTMVDRVGRWIEELSGMENDTLLQLGDQIRDEMGQDQAKQFISAVAPAIQQALENLKQTRETLATGVRTLTGEEQGAEMLGAEPTADLGGDDFGGEADLDSLNAEEPAGDEFGAAEPAAGGIETSGREQRESIDRSNRLLKVLAG